MTFSLEGLKLPGPFFFSLESSVFFVTATYINLALYSWMYKRDGRTTLLPILLPYC